MFYPSKPGLTGLGEDNFPRCQWLWSFLYMVIVASTVLEAALKSQKDPLMFGKEIFESYPRFSKMREFEGFKKRGAYNPRFLEKGQQKILNSKQKQYLGQRLLP